jgi:hypothetical protein
MINITSITRQILWASVAVMAAKMGRDLRMPR